jgi:hypothetical protein
MSQLDPSSLGFSDETVEAAALPAVPLEGEAGLWREQHFTTQRGILYIHIYIYIHTYNTTYNVYLNVCIYI